MDKFGSFLLGLGIGVGLGMVFAPQSGEETRGMLKSRADDGADYLKRQSEGLRTSASDIVDKGRNAASDMVDKGRNVVNRQRDSISDAIEAGKQAYRDKVDQAAS